MKIYTERNIQFRNKNQIVPSFEMYKNVSNNKSRLEQSTDYNGEKQSIILYGRISTA